MSGVGDEGEKGDVSQAGKSTACAETVEKNASSLQNSSAAVCVAAITSRSSLPLEHSSDTSKAGADPLRPGTVMRRVPFLSSAAISIVWGIG